MKNLKKKKKNIENDKEDLAKNRTNKKEAYENFKTQFDYFEKKLKATSFVEEASQSRINDSYTIEYNDEK
ncbi:hypothetical protein F6Y05_34180 [Bacillus megaterium]|nr:hypothetical protein [Priestia megaterium]